MMRISDISVFFPSVLALSMGRRATICTNVPKAGGSSISATRNCLTVTATLVQPSKFSGAKSVAPCVQLPLFFCIFDSHSSDASVKRGSINGSVADAAKCRVLPYCSRTTSDLEAKLSCSKHSSSASRHNTIDRSAIGGSRRPVPRNAADST
jgi:hypothetical protein